MTTPDELGPGSVYHELLGALLIDPDVLLAEIAAGIAEIAAGVEPQTAAMPALPPPPPRPALTTGGSA